MRRRRRVSQKPFLESPFMIVWQLKRPSEPDWSCLQTEDVNEESPPEFSLKEKIRIIDEISKFGPLKLVFSGGDLFRQADFLELVSYATTNGLKVFVRPSITNSITKKALRDLQQAGVTCFCIDLHGATKELHNSMAGTESYDMVIDVINQVVELGIPLQINTFVSPRNHNEIRKIAEKIKLYPLVLWNLVLSVAKTEEQLSACDCELLFQWLYDFSKTVPFDIKTTSGQHFNRVIIQNKRRESKIAGNYIHFADALLRGTEGPKGGMERAPYSVNDGKGMLFISESGNVYPSAMFPVNIGHVREHSLQKIYRESLLLKKLKNSDLLKDKCGVCEYRNVCGGNRARAYFLTGNYLASDPSCIYTPTKIYQVDKQDNNLLMNV